MRDPVVGLLDRVAAPAVEGVVQTHAGLELLEIVAVHARQAERGGEQAGALRRELGPRRIGAPDDEGEPVERRKAGQAEQLEAGMLLYDAFYRWCRDATTETHNWPTNKVKA